MNSAVERMILRMFDNGFTLPRIAKDAKQPVHIIFGLLLKRGVHSLTLEKRMPKKRDHES